MSTKRRSPGPNPPAILADAVVHIHSAHTSLARLKALGTFSRERMVDRALCQFTKHLTVVTYGDSADEELAATIPPSDWEGILSCITNDQTLEAARFQASVPERVAAALAATDAKSALVYTDQHNGGEVAVQTAALLRARGIHAGLVARAGYHWSWTVARDTAPHHPLAIAASAREGDLCRAADVIVATTPRITANLCWQHRLDPSRVRIVPNFVQPESAVPPFAQREPGTILVAGRLSPEKRIDLLIRAVSMATRSNPIIKLIVIGDGPEREALVALAESFEAPVEFRPRIPHIQLLGEMGRCNVYAQPSRFEGHPKTILEAMAMGAPTLVVRAPGVDDEINPNVTGIVSGESEADLCAAMLWLVANPEIARRSGARAARDIRGRLSFPLVFDKLLESFHTAMHIAKAHRSDCPPSTPVRWDQTLLNASPDAAAAEFASSLAAFAKRLEPRTRAIFMDGIAARFGSLPDADALSLTCSPDARVPRRTAPAKDL